MGSVGMKFWKQLWCFHYWQYDYSIGRHEESFFDKDKDKKIATQAKTIETGQRNP